MRKPDQDEAKNKKFHERLERISRRRFIRMAALGGVASAGAVVIGRGHAQTAQQQYSSDYIWKMSKEAKRCSNTQRLLTFKDNTVNDVFKDKSFAKILTEGLDDHKPDSTEYKLIKAIIDAIPSGDKDAPVRDFFVYDKTIGNPALATAFRNAKEEFSIPFANSDVKRDLAKKLLVKDDDGTDHPFLRAFGNQWIRHFLAKTRNKVDPDDEKILNRAHEAGFFNSASADEYARMFAAGNDECAKLYNGQWRCSYSPGSKCEIVDGYPTVSTDICP